MTSEILADKICKLAEVRREKDQSKDALDDLTAEFCLLPEVISVKESLDGASREVAQLEDEVRAQGLKDFQEGLEPHPATNVQPRRGLKLVYEKEDALDYARLNLQAMPDLVKLDNKNFEAIAKVLKPDFVKFEDDTKVEIKKDLSAYLPVENGV